MWDVVLSALVRAGRDASGTGAAVSLRKGDRIRYYRLREKLR
jgi:hypothetical protein